MKLTANYGLRKPDGNDAVNIEDLNYNADILDKKVKEVESNAGSVKSVNGKIGAVVLNAAEIKTNSGASVETQLAENMKLGQNNQSINKVKALTLKIDTRTTELIEENGLLKKVIEKDGTTIVKTTTLDYDSNTNLISVIENAGGTTITKTLNYDSTNNLKTITKAVS
ncbi:hypothetical protein [Clostridium lundense]|uniref:hypothetical protein n=1 Tax=Clostridium lundense TaxID=319475 RepID=UPI000485C73F|nr:hypothetical protein [Clostridium lundense]